MISHVIVLLVLVTALLVPARELTADGVVLINHDRAIAGGVTPRDSPGYPVTIAESGSYRLSGNLFAPDANSTAIEITAAHVTLDLNGFAILGTTNCSGGFLPCAGDGTGNGITTTPGVTCCVVVRNGMVQGMGNFGILLQGDAHVVEHVIVRSNGNGGIRIVESQDAAGSTVQYVTAQRNGSRGLGPFRLEAGIYLDSGRVSHSVADVNVNGIVLLRGLANHNQARRNLISGLLIQNAGALGNVLIENGSFSLLNVGIGGNLGQNLCGAAACYLRKPDGAEARASPWRIWAELGSRINEGCHREGAVWWSPSLPGNADLAEQTR